ncbi:MAG: flagellar hook capping FlgD N-terminal domain-containing protein [Rhodobacterales bacterium]|nr:flagellar hook capping FlgD N-terminal domain-containing protein [Rhodobacterales bacterium]
MEISTNTPTVPATPPPTTQPPAANDLLASDYLTFLNMLAVQMQNQDPLNPIDSTDFSTQLAQFSALEQQVKTNDLLTGLGAQMTLSGMSELAGWVGMEARTIAPAQFDGDPITLIPSPASLSDKTFLIVRDEAGAVVQRKEIPVSAAPYVWDGIDDSGSAFPDGLYSFEVESQANGEILDTTNVANYAQIVEAQTNNGQVILVMEGGARVEAGAVTALRNPLLSP